MADWEFAQQDPSEELAQMHFFSMKKCQPGGDVEFVITVKEFATPKMQSMKFLATADKQVNQKGAPITPCGFGSSLNAALSECLKAIQRFPYEGT